MKQSDFRPLGLLVLAATTGLLLLAAPASAATFFTQQTNASPGQEADVCIWMSGGNNQVAGVQMDLTWDPRCMTPPSGNRPRCRSNPDTGKTVQSAARGESTVRAIMLSFSDVDPIPDGELFCCGFRISANPPEGQCSVSFSNLIASTPTGQRTDARGGRGGAINITRSGGGAPAPAPGGYEPAPPADSGSSDDPAPVAAPPADPAGDARAAAAPDQVDATDPTGTGGGRSAGATDLGGVPGRPASGDGEFAADRQQPAGVAGDSGDTGDTGDTGMVPDGREMPAAVAEPAQAVAESDDDEAVAEQTPTQTPEAAAAQATVAPTATKPPATPTQAQPTATPTTKSSGWLGGCTLMR